MRRSLRLALFLTGFTPVATVGQSPLEIIDRVDRLLRGESSRGTIEMEIRTENWERSLRMQAWSLGTDYSLIRVESPAREAGTATLKADTEVWNYLPRVDRTIKVPASMMMGSWMGSHFTNDDLVHESRLIEDYDIALAFDGPADGPADDAADDDAVWDLQLTPKPEAPVVWGRIDYRVRKADLMPLWAKYFDEDNALVRTMSFEDFREMGGRLVPARMVVQPQDKPEESTVILYRDLEFDIGLEENFFSLRNLRRGSSR
jgi:Outer membrane lipoprotein-sorting protein